MAKARTETKSTGYEIFIGVLSLLSIVNVILSVVFVHDDSLRAVLTAMNVLFSAIFLSDFFYRLLTSPSRGEYFWRRFGWADLLASLPFPPFKVLRVFRLIRVVRLLRTLGPRTVGRTLIHDRAGSALLVLLLMGIFVLEFGSLFMLYLEKDAPGSNIKTGSDALWYTLVTISTVGYGDHFPVTSAGRFMGTFIIVVGVGIFGTFTGYLANSFVAPKGDGEPVADEASPNAADTESSAAPAALSPATLDELRGQLAKSEAMLAEMRTLLDRHAGV